MALSPSLKQEPCRAAGMHRIGHAHAVCGERARSSSHAELTDGAAPCSVLPVLFPLHATRVNRAELSVSIPTERRALCNSPLSRTVRELWVDSSHLLIQLIFIPNRISSLLSSYPFLPQPDPSPLLDITGSPHSSFPIWSLHPRRSFVGGRRRRAPPPSHHLLSRDRSFPQVSSSSSSSTSKTRSSPSSSFPKAALLQLVAPHRNHSHSR